MSHYENSEASWAAWAARNADLRQNGARIMIEAKASIPPTPREWAKKVLRQQLRDDLVEDLVVLNHNRLQGLLAVDRARVNLVRAQKTLGETLGLFERVTDWLTGGLVVPLGEVAAIRHKARKGRINGRR